MHRTLERLLEDEPEGCGCAVAFEDGDLVVDADDCADGGTLATSPDCRRTVVAALTERDVEAVRTRADGVERVYRGDGAALLVAAGRFADVAAVHDADLAERAKTDPLGAAHEATGRAGPVARIAAETGLATARCAGESYTDILRPYAGPTISRWRVVPRPPPDAELVEQRTLETDATARIYAQPDRELRTYHLEPVEYALDEDALATLAAAHERLASGAVSGGQRAPARAIRRVADGTEQVARLTTALRKHTRGYGLLEDIFADPAVSDAFATAPVSENRLRVRVGDEPMRTNVRLTDDGVEALASRFRRTSGRAFSRASPVIDAVASAGDRDVRVAGVTEPASDGVAFAFRAHDREALTLPALVASGTLPADAGALLSVAVERGAAMLIAGTRGAGKTTLLGALLWELPAGTRTVVIEDTPELPVAALQGAGRDVQVLRTATDDDDAGVTPTEALRAALRLGEGALVVGEVRGEEAAALYEAMRVGAGGSTVLGTIHGDGGAAVRERVVTDLGVPVSSFAATDLLVTLGRDDGGDRRITAVEEVVETDAGVAFEPLFEIDGDGLATTGRIARGNSRAVAALGSPGEPYAAVRDELDARADWLRERVDREETGPTTYVEAQADRRTC